MSIGYQGPPEWAEFFRDRGSAALAALDLPDAEVSLVVCDDAAIRPLNREWRGKDAATDVLSFPQLELEGPMTGPLERRPDGPPLVLGDIVISLETASRQAAAYGHTEKQELIVLLVHGLLHLLGYTHGDAVSRARMGEMEARCLSGIEPGYAGLVARAGPPE